VTYGSVLCEHCTAVCCGYIALPIEKPTTPGLRRHPWYVMHDGISVFVEEGDWYIQVAARCRNLQRTNAAASTKPVRHLPRVRRGRVRLCRGRIPLRGLPDHARGVETFAIRKLANAGLSPSSDRADTGRRALASLTVLSDRR